MNKIYIIRLAIILSALLSVPLSFLPAHADSSTNVSLLERELYSDMEFWAAEGLTESNLSSIKPFARSEVGRQLVAALDKCKAMETPSATCRKIQQHWAKIFEPEIAEARSPEHASGTFLKPVENFSAAYNYVSGPFSFYNNEGINYYEGSNALLQYQAEARLWHVFSFYVDPILIYNQHSGPPDQGGDINLQLHKGYAKLNICNLEVEVGRDSLWWGPGYNGALLMSNNAQPFDMIKLSNPEPILLPWIFSYVGPVQFNMIFSQLNDERADPAAANPFLYGLRLGFKPHPFLELGVSQLALFGGPGRRNLSLGNILDVLYSDTAKSPSDYLDSKEEVAVDWALTIPNIKKYIFLADSIKIYCEVGADDAGYPPDKHAWLPGFALYKPLGLETAVFHGEYAILSPYGTPGVWYANSTYPMTYEGQVFGHHAGTDAQDIFLDWSQSFEKFFYKLGFDREISGVQLQKYPQFTNRYFGEIGYQLTIKRKITLQYGYEDIINAGNVQGVWQRNFYLGVEYAINF